MTRRRGDFARRRRRADRRCSAGRPVVVAAHATTRVRPGLSGFAFAPPLDSSAEQEVLRYAILGQRLFDVRAASADAGRNRAAHHGIRARSRRPRVHSRACVFRDWRVARDARSRAATRRARRRRWRVRRSFPSASTRTLRGCSIRPCTSRRGGSAHGNAGALMTTSAIVAARRARGVSSAGASRVALDHRCITILLVAGLGPFLLRELARGVQIPQHGVDAALWLIWEVPLFLAAVSVLLAGAAAGATILGPRRGLSPWVAPLVGDARRGSRADRLEAPGRLALVVHASCGSVAIAMLALSRRTRFVICQRIRRSPRSARRHSFGGARRAGALRRPSRRSRRAESDGFGRRSRCFAASVRNCAPMKRRLTREALLKHSCSQTFPPREIRRRFSPGRPTARAVARISRRPTFQFRMTRSWRTRRRGARARNATILEAVPTDTAVELVMAAPSRVGRRDGGRRRAEEPTVRDRSLRAAARSRGRHRRRAAVHRSTSRAPVPRIRNADRELAAREGASCMATGVVRTGTGVRARARRSRAASDRTIWRSAAR